MTPSPRVLAEIPMREPLGLADVGLSSQSRASVTRVLLLGRGDAIGHRVQAVLAGVDVDRDHVAFRARPGAGSTRGALLADLARWEPHGVLATDLDGDIIGVLPTPPTDVEHGVVGVGPAVPLHRLAESFELATRAIAAATAFGLHGVYAFADLGLLPTIVADQDVGEALWRRHLLPVAATRCGSVLIAAVRAWFDSDMHVDAAAAALVLHPNTLRNHLTRFEELAGADLRDPFDAMQVWWALQYAAQAGVRCPA